MEQRRVGKPKKVGPDQPSPSPTTAKGHEDVQLDDNLFAKNIRMARRGAAPSNGMTSEHLFPLLESDRTLGSLCKVAGFFAKGQVPTDDALGFAVGMDDSSPRASSLVTSSDAWSHA